MIADTRLKGTHTMMGMRVGGVMMLGWMWYTLCGVSCAVVSSSSSSVVASVSGATVLTSQNIFSQVFAWVEWRASVNVCVDVLT